MKDEIPRLSIGIAYKPVHNPIDGSRVELNLLGIASSMKDDGYPVDFGSKLVFRLPIEKYIWGTLYRDGGAYVFKEGPGIKVPTPELLIEINKVGREILDKYVPDAKFCVCGVDLFSPDLQEVPESDIARSMAGFVGMLGGGKISRSQPDEMLLQYSIECL